MKNLSKSMITSFVIMISTQLFPGNNNLNKTNYYSSNIDMELQDPSEDCPPEEVDGLLVFEAERFILKGAWKIGEDVVASGGKYIYFDGPNSYKNANPDNNITYTFKINNPGTYNLKWMMRQPEGERGTDLGNDAWIYFDGDIARGNAGFVLDQFYKFVGRSTDAFTLNGALDINHVSHGVSVIFPSAGEYTLNLRGRSHHFQLDRIILSKGIDVNDLPSKVALIEETNTCEEEDDNPTGEEIGLINPFTTFDDSILEMPFKVNYKAVEARNIVIEIAELNGTVLQSSSTPITTGSGEKDIIVTLSNPLLWGETLKIVTSLKSTSGETIRQSQNSFSITADPSKNNVEILEYPAIINNVNNTLRVKYDITKDRDILIQLKKNKWTVKTIRTRIPKGSHERDVNINLGTLPGDSKGFFWRAMIRVIKAPYRGNLHLTDALDIEVDKDADLSVDDISGKQEITIDAYPNPFISDVTVDIPSNSDFESLEVVDLQGKTILKQNITSNTINLNLSAPKGIYLLKLTGSNSYSIKKLIKN